MKDGNQEGQDSLAAIEEEVDAELAHVELSADPADADEPIRDIYEVRLQGLRAAVIGVRDLENRDDTG